MDQVPTPQLPQPVMSVYKKPSYKKFFIPAVIVIILVILSLLTYFLRDRIPFFRSNPGNSTLPLDEITLKTPLYDFSGRIEEISGDTLTVSRITSVLSNKPITPDNPPKTDKVTYKVKVTSETKLLAMPAAIGYSLKLASPSAEVIKISDFRVGQTVNIVSKEDLKKITSGQIEAVSISAEPGLTVIQGSIKEISGNSLVIHSGPPSVAEEKDYQFTVSGETEIVAADITAPIEPPKTRLPVSSLSKDDQVIVYSDKDINLFEDLKALKIDVFPN